MEAALWQANWLVANDRIDKSGTYRVSIDEAHMLCDELHDLFGVNGLVEWGEFHTEAVAFARTMKSMEQERHAALPVWQRGAKTILRVIKREKGYGKL